MASLISAFPEYLTAAAIARDTVTNVGGIKTNSWEAVDTIECLYWEGAAAQTFVSEKFRDSTDAVIGVYPGTDIQKNDRVTVEGLVYQALSPDNIGAADDVIIVALELFA